MEFVWHNAWERAVSKRMASNAPSATSGSAEMEDKDKDLVRYKLIWIAWPDPFKNTADELVWIDYTEQKCENASGIDAPKNCVIDTALVLANAEE